MKMGDPSVPREGGPSMLGCREDRMEEVHCVEARAQAEAGVHLPHEGA